MAIARLGIVKEASGKVWIGVGIPGWVSGDPNFRYEGYVLADSFENVGFGGAEVSGVAPQFILKGAVNAYPWDSGRFSGFRSITLKTRPDSPVTTFDVTLNDKIIAENVSSYTYQMSLIPAVVAFITGMLLTVLGLS